MEHAFDAAIRQLGGGISRRGLWWVAASSAFGVSLLGRPLSSEAKNKRKRRKKRKKKHQLSSPPPPPPPVVNEYGCLDIGQPCQGNDTLCCSGICDGTAESSECVGHNALTCTAAQDNCVAQPNPCGMFGLCFKTTGKASFCGNGSSCVVCAKDSDCEATMGSGAACVVCPAACTVTKTACIAAAS